MSDCQYCHETENIKTITVPVRKRGNITKYKKIRACENCIKERYPEYEDTQHIKVRGAVV